MPAPSLLNVKETCKRLRVSRSTLYKRVRAGNIPAPVYVTPTAPRWREDEIDAYIEKISESRAA